MLSCAAVARGGEGLRQLRRQVPDICLTPAEEAPLPLSRSGFGHVPQDVWTFFLLPHLSFKDMCVISQVSKTLHVVAGCQARWRQLWLENEANQGCAPGLHRSAVAAALAGSWKSLFRCSTLARRQQQQQDGWLQATTPEVLAAIACMLGPPGQERNLNVQFLVDGSGASARSPRRHEFADADTLSGAGLVLL